MPSTVTSRIDDFREGINMNIFSIASDNGIPFTPKVASRRFLVTELLQEEIQVK